MKLLERLRARRERRRCEKGKHAFTSSIVPARSGWRRVRTCTRPGCDFEDSREVKQKESQFYTSLAYRDRRKRRRPVFRGIFTTRVALDLQERTLRRLERELAQLRAEGKAE